MEKKTNKKFQNADEVVEAVNKWFADKAEFLPFPENPKYKFKNTVHLNEPSFCGMCERPLKELHVYQKKWLKWLLEHEPSIMGPEVSYACPHCGALQVKPGRNTTKASKTPTVNTLFKTALFLGVTGFCFRFLPSDFLPYAQWLWIGGGIAVFVFFYQGDLHLNKLIHEEREKEKAEKLKEILEREKKHQESETTS